MDGTAQLIEDLADLALGRRVAVPSPRSVDRSDIDRHLVAAEHNAAIDVLPDPPGRNRGTKRLILKSGRFVFTRQSAFNRAVLPLVEHVLDESASLSSVVEQERRRSAAFATDVESTLRDAAIARQRQVAELRDEMDARYGEVLGTVNELRAKVGTLEDEIDGAPGSRVASAIDLRVEQRTSANIDELRGYIDGLGAQIDDLQSALVLEQHRRGILERELRSVRQELRINIIGLEPENDVKESPLGDTSLSELYERFEQYFRPTGATLDDRFAAYLPDLETLRGGSLQLLDIGTGRGDFLEVLRTAGVPARGIDLNPEAVEAAVAAGLDVIEADARTYLASLANESVAAVTAFHVVEHLAPEDLVSLVDEIVRVLSPGGTVILETPNPTNLVVGAASFYHDPTHNRPVTPDYLSFLLRDRGLVDIQTRFLHPTPDFELPLNLDGITGGASVAALLKDVQWALKGPQDYAVIASGPRMNA